ncbi:MAG TPA: aspartate aminotransferase family protein [Candidatus Sulfotelmatobacter sp.]|nr:aspartate aminotransferase family protein [Candidatus Sulfotelmatobacter sp.]
MASPTKSHGPGATRGEIYHTPMEADLTFETEKSRQIYERTRGVLIEGSSSSSRGPATFGGYPLFMERGRGSRIFDVDGNEYIDWMMAFGALPLGHAHPEVTEAITEAAASGAHFATATAVELDVAEMLQKIVPNAERVRFANTGTEAMMAAIRLARGVTGRPKILKFEGHYHGWHDDLLVSSNVVPPATLGLRSDPVKIPDSSGLNRTALDDTIVVPWNDLAALQRAIENHPCQIAALITEGIMANMGVIPPAEGYLPGLQKLAKAHNIVFILDETVTGFRIAPGGCQEHYKLSPDLVTFGKALGCGLPVAALVGRADIMDALRWGGVLHYGTHNGSRIGMFAARANLRVLTRNNSASFKRTWKTAELLCSGFRAAFQEKGIRAIVQNIGPMFQIMFTDQPAIRDYRDFCQFVDRAAFQKFVLSLFPHGIYASPSAALHSIVTLAHTEQDVAQTIAAARKALDETAEHSR